MAAAAPPPPPSPPLLVLPLPLRSRRWRSCMLGNVHTHKPAAAWLSNLPYRWRGSPTLLNHWAFSVSGTAWHGMAQRGGRRAHAATWLPACTLACFLVLLRARLC